MKLLVLLCVFGLAVSGEYLKESNDDINQRGLRPRDFKLMIFDKNKMTNSGHHQVVCSSPNSCSGIGSTIKCTYQHTKVLRYADVKENDVFFCESYNLDGWSIISHSIKCRGKTSPTDLDISSPESCFIEIYARGPFDNVTGGMIVFLIVVIVLLFLVLACCCPNNGRHGGGSGFIDFIIWDSFCRNNRGGSWGGSSGASTRF